MINLSGWMYNIINGGLNVIDNDKLVCYISRPSILMLRLDVGMFVCVYVSSPKAINN